MYFSGGRVAQKVDGQMQPFRMRKRNITAGFTKRRLKAHGRVANFIGDFNRDEATPRGGTSISLNIIHLELIVTGLSVRIK
jgi:hypothetical protein